MKITLLITPEALGSNALQGAMDAKRDALAKQGVTVSQALGRKNHTRLFMAVSDPGRPDWLRLSRGYATPEAQLLLSNTVFQELAAERERFSPDHLVLSCAQLSSGLRDETEIHRLAKLLAPLSDDIEAVLHVEEPARALVRAYADGVLQGRTEGLDQELALASRLDWWTAALETWFAPEPKLNRHPEFGAAPHWIDWAALVARWERVLGPGRVRLRPFDAGLIGSDKVTREVEAMLGLDGGLGKVDPAPLDLPSDASLTRARQMNALFQKLQENGRLVTRMMWRRLLSEVAVDGTPVDPGALAPVSRHFAADIATLVARFPEIAPAMERPAPAPDWVEPDPLNGFRATQYLTVFLPRITKAADEFVKGQIAKSARAPVPAKPQAMSDAAERLLPPLAKATFAELSRGRFAPHNRLGRVNEEDLAAPYSEMPPRRLPRGSTGNVVIGCMKNEGPYILEWIAYHRAIGVDTFVIYTNGCEDGTDRILDRLQDLGVVQHRSNDDWKGKSPQQAALNKSQKEPVVQNADWLIHIDVDEFINIRTGNGTLPDLFAAMPEATAVAMTWRLFGHGGVTGFVDEPVTAQFTRCAPAYCPKPHTVWGFKTMFRNDGAYAKLSCHRPNKLQSEARDRVRWFNGSGQPMADSLKDKGWRSGVDDIGYDLVQLNHYALRSAESFLIKRQRGRALHVDRSIGLNYWIRMDWDDATDVTIQRNLPRLKTEMARLMADPALKRLHDAAVAWHRAKADELHATPEFEELYGQALQTRLSGMERVAYALALDMES